MKRIGKQTLCKGCFWAVISLVIVFLSACTKDDAEMKVPIFNKSSFSISSDAASDSLFEKNKSPYHLHSLTIVDKTSNETLSSILFSGQDQNVVDHAGNKLGEIKYGKNDILEVCITNFCTIKRKLDSEKGKMYIITPSADKRNDIFMILNINLDKGIGGRIEIH